MKKVEFLKSERFGQLYYHNVYAFYGEPLMFTALNEFEQLFFCYALGTDDKKENELWFIVPTSQDKVNKLEQKDIPIISMMKDSKLKKIYLLKINLSSGDVSVDQIEPQNIPYLMPDDSLFIEENINWDGTRKHTHRIRVAATNLTDNKLTELITLFSGFVKNILKNNELEVEFYPKDAITGSFVYRVEACFRKKVTQDKLEEGYSSLSLLSSKDNFEQALGDRTIDLKLTWKLFSLMKKAKADIQFIDEDSTDNIFELKLQNVNELLPLLDDKLNVYLDNTMIPQANDIKRVKEYIDILKSENIVTGENFGLTPRQVDYYSQACRLLGLINDYYYLTPIGCKVSELKQYEDWLSILKTQFENSECGYLWMKDQNVTSILDIDPDSSAQYLLENVSGLSEDTKKRRASTLKTWVREFQQYL